MFNEVQTVAMRPGFIRVKSEHLNQLQIISFFWIEGYLIINMGSDVFKRMFYDPSGEEYLNLCKALKISPDPDTIEAIEKSGQIGQRNQS